MLELCVVRDTRIQFSANLGLKAWTSTRGTWALFSTEANGGRRVGCFMNSSTRKQSQTSTAINANTPIASSPFYPKHPRISLLMPNCTCSPRPDPSTVQTDPCPFKCDRRVDHGDNVRFECRVSRRQVFADGATRDGVSREGYDSRRISRRHIPNTFVRSLVR